MRDIDDTLITRALQRLRDDASSLVRAPGTGQFPLRAARRRRKITGFSLVGAMFLGVPALGVVSGQGLPPRPAPSTAPAVDARLFPALLADEGAPVPRDPKWGNCSLKIARKLGTHTENAVYAENVVYTNLDNDPAVETAAFVRCMLPGGGLLSQIVAYDLDSSGKPVSLGAIVPPLTPESVVGLLERAGSGVSARVVSGVYDPVGQIRGYAWNGKAFVQVGGETSFPQALTTDLLVSSDRPLVLTRKADGNYKGVLKFTVTNNGPNPTRELKLVMEFGPAAESVEQRIGKAEVTRYSGLERPALQPGQSTTVEVPLTTDGFARVVAVGVYSHIVDLDLRNNYTFVPISFS